MTKQLLAAAKQRVEAALTSADIDKIINSVDAELSEKWASALRVSLKKNMEFISKEAVSLKPTFDPNDEDSEPGLKLVLSRRTEFSAEYTLALGKLLNDVNMASVDGKASWFLAEYSVRDSTVLISLP